MGEGKIIKITEALERFENLFSKNKAFLNVTSKVDQDENSLQFRYLLFYSVPITCESVNQRNR